MCNRNKSSKHTYNEQKLYQQIGLQTEQKERVKEKEKRKGKQLISTKIHNST